ncbi:hypothetical protein X771_11500 [Mesorhizobium sp. LSJC277A00]|nr:hypothetical protein X771_11500 [Mesorhizobium sp. LSJC277A00]
MLPSYLPRVEMVVDIEDHACPCCRNDLHLIGEDVSERLDIVPAQLRVIVVRRPKYASHASPLLAAAPISRSRRAQAQEDEPFCRSAVEAMHIFGSPTWIRRADQAFAEWGKRVMEAVMRFS